MTEEAQSATIAGCALSCAARCLSATLYEYQRCSRPPERPHFAVN
jgi:hypothetical protein